MRRRLLFLGLVISLLGSIVIGALPPIQASAATPSPTTGAKPTASAPLVFGKNSDGTFSTTRNISCKATITNGSALHNDSLTTAAINTMEQSGASLPQDATNTFESAKSGNYQLGITFSGANSIDNAACGEAVTLIQSVTAPGTFYGFIMEGPVSGSLNDAGFASFITAQVDHTAKTVSFADTLHQTVFFLQVADNNKAFENSAYWKAGGGSGSGSGGADCLASGSCTAKFINSTVIQAGGDTFTNTVWTGHTLQYFLTKSTNAARDANNANKAGCTPELDLDTTQADKTGDTGHDINIDGGSPSADQIYQMMVALQKDGPSGHTFTMKYIDYDTRCNPAGGDTTPRVQTAGLTVWAAYYPTQKQIDMFFTSGGDNESHYIGDYTPGKGNDFILTGWDQQQNCQASIPNFDLSKDPSKAKTGDIVDAVWHMTAEDGQCSTSTTSGPLTTHVGIYIEDKTATPPDLTNNNGNTKPTCESSGFGFDWAICAIINLLGKAVDGTFNHIVKPLLNVSPLVANDNSATYVAWSYLRIYGNVFLLIALLVIVFGESIGGGLVDAYTAKKVLPRLLAAAILINLSFYIVALAVDVTNIVGGGLKDLLTTPFHVSNGFALQIHDGKGTAVDIGIAIIGFFALKGVVIEVAAMFGAFVLPLIFFLTIAILLTVLVRQALIIILVIVSPVAFALYALPNTEKYFRKWWDTLFRTLLVYPLIAVMFALGNIMSVVVGSLTGGGVSQFASILLSVVAMVTPLVLIPFAFTIAGSIIGRLHDTLTNYGKRAHQGILGNQQNPNSLRNRTKYNLASKYAQKRERAVTSGSAEGAGVFRRSAGRLANFGNLQATRSRYNRERADTLASQIATGDDSNIRDMFIAWDPTANGGEGAWFRRMDMVNGRGIPGASAVYSGAGAQQRGQTAHNKAMSLYGGDKSAVQEALYYEWKKTGFDPAQMQRLQGQYGEILSEHGFTNDEGNEIMTGVGFKHQGQSLVGKHTRFNERDGQWAFRTNYSTLAKEGAMNIGTYGWSNQDISSFDALADGHAEAVAAIGAGNEAQNDQTVVTEGVYSGQTRAQVWETRNRIERMADALDPSAQPGAAGVRVNTVGEDGTPEMTGLRGVSSAPVDVQQAAIRFAQRVRGGNGGGGPAAPQRGGDDGGDWRNQDGYL